MSDSAVPPFRFLLRVYWEDTDAGGVVFYANYLKFFERARTEWLRSLGHEQERLRQQTGMVFIVAETQVRYLRPARLDDELAVTVEVVQAGRAQMTMAQQAWRLHADGEELVAEGTIRVACVAAGTFKPRPIPTAVAKTLPMGAARSLRCGVGVVAQDTARLTDRPTASLTLHHENPG